MQYVVIVILLLILSFIYGMEFKEKKMKSKILDKNTIVDCFKDVDWGVHHFHVGSVVMKTIDGEESFYKAPPIKEAIEKLNAVLEVSPANTASTRLGAGTADPVDETVAPSG